MWKEQKKLRVIVDGKDASELTSNAQAKETGELLFGVSALPLTSKTSEVRDVSHCLNLELAIRYSVRSCSRRLSTRPALSVLLTSNWAASGSCRKIRRSLRGLSTEASGLVSTTAARLCRDRRRTLPFAGVLDTELAVSFAFARESR